jgi:tetratricopeptide (TPR) repeat protein
MGLVALRRGDLATARRCNDHILAQARETADRFRIARSTQQLAELDLIEGRHAEALALLAESLQLTQEQGRIGEMPQVLRAMGRALLGLGRPGEAASALAAGTRSGGPRSTLPPDDPAAVASAIAACRTALGDAAFDRAWQQGAVLSLERATEHALASARAEAVRPGCA